MKGKVLLIEDKRGMRTMLTTALREEGYNVKAVSTGTSALKHISSRQKFDIIISDVCLPGEDGIEVLSAAQKNMPCVPVILMTAFGTIEMAVKAMKKGARDFITKPFVLSELIHLVDHYTASTGSGGDTMIGSNRIFLNAVERAKLGAATNLNILILGESGTGKELLSRMIHRESARKDGPFIPVNCAAIPSDLMESELFGAEKGAYTGASEQRPGRFEIAEGGTVFLDEIGDMAQNLQGKILRVLQEKEFSRVGGNSIIKADIRIISASNKNLEKEMEKNRFRRDLYYRLCEFPVLLPPLRERSDDIPALVEYFLNSAGYIDLEIDENGMDLLENYSWPGNIRELRNIVLRAAALCKDSRIISPDLFELKTEIPGGFSDSEESGLLEAGSRAAREKEMEMIQNTLRKCGGNRSEAAKLLKVSYRTLLYRMKELKIR